MTVYLNISAKDAGGCRLRFHRAAALPPAQRALWGSFNALPIEEWSAPFAQMAMPIALSVLIQADRNRMLVSAGYVEDETTQLVQHVKPSAGYVVREFGITRTSHLHGANIDSRTARKKGFLPRVMAAFNEIDLRDETDKICIAAINAGIYAWMSYGAVPSYRKEFCNKARGQWMTLCDAAREKGLSVSHRLMDWVHSIECKSDDYFREPFDVRAGNDICASLKALLTGDLTFLRKTDYRFSPYMQHDNRFADPMNATLHIDPQDLNLQQHLKRRIDMALRAA